MFPGQNPDDVPDLADVDRAMHILSSFVRGDEVSRTEVEIESARKTVSGLLMPMRKMYVSAMGDTSEQQDITASERQGNPPTLGGAEAVLPPAGAEPPE